GRFGAAPPSWSAGAAVSPACAAIAWRAATARAAPARSGLSGISGLACGPLAAACARAGATSFTAPESACARWISSIGAAPASMTFALAACVLGEDALSSPPDAAPLDPTVLGMDLAPLDVHDRVAPLAIDRPRRQ